MGNITQRALPVALDSYLLDNVLKRRKVFELTEKLRSLDDDIGDIAVELVARCQPVANDLRFILAPSEII